VSTPSTCGQWWPRLAHPPKSWAGCGDGLTDLVRVRNGEVCYWPNLGYGRFGAKVTMDNAPWFDAPDGFDQRRVRLADIDGSGTNDVIYLGRDGARLYFNQSGNRLSDGRRLAALPRVDDVSSVTTADLLGNGTACLVWSSPLAGDAHRPVRYIDLMGGTKPHLLARSTNNLGADTEVQYAPSTRFYLADKREGRPWVTRLPFPVYVVERVVTSDRVSGNRFVTRYAYHHGYFDGVEREFRGFGVVEQWDTEEFAALNAGGAAPAATNLDAASHVPPVMTKTWFHTGAYLGGGHVSDYFAGLLDAGDAGEYYREPGLSDAQARALLLADTVLPDGLSVEEECEAVRVLKGSMLRHEVYALDGTNAARHPYTIIEQNFTVRAVQRRGGNRHAVFFPHPREALSYHYERAPADPRVGHQLTLEVDEYGNVLRSAAVAYGRRRPDPALSPADQAKQRQTLVTYTENQVTNPIDAGDDHRTPLPCESRTYEITGLTPAPSGVRFTMDQVSEAAIAAAEIDYASQPSAGSVQKRLIEHVRTRYRRNDLAGSLPPCVLDSRALPFESYRLAFTPGLIAKVYGTRVTEGMLGDEARYVHVDADPGWWIPSGMVFYSPNTADTPPEELAHARRHFFLPHRYRDPFHTDALPTEGVVDYDGHDLLIRETRDALGNRVTAGERVLSGNTVLDGNDYRVLQPVLVMDPNRNRSVVAVDALGLVVGTPNRVRPMDGEQATERRPYGRCSAPDPNDLGRDRPPLATGCALVWPMPRISPAVSRSAVILSEPTEPLHPDSRQRRRLPSTGPSRCRPLPTRRRSAKRCDATSRAHGETAVAPALSPEHGTSAQRQLPVPGATSSASNRRGCGRRRLPRDYRKPNPNTARRGPQAGVSQVMRTGALPGTHARSRGSRPAPAQPRIQHPSLPVHADHNKTAQRRAQVAERSVPIFGLVRQGRRPSHAAGFRTPGSWPMSVARSAGV
jgi:hypothetical protein